MKYSAYKYFRPEIDGVKDVLDFFWKHTEDIIETKDEGTQDERDCFTKKIRIEIFVFDD